MSRKPIKEENNIELNLDKLLNYILTGEERIQKKIKKNDVVLVLGNTGAGKIQKILNQAFFLVLNKIKFIKERVPWLTI